METTNRRTILGVLTLCALAALACFGPAPAKAAPDKQVTVDNPETNPVNVRDVDNAARQFFQTGTNNLTNEFNPTGFGQTLVTVPGGLVLVIEYVSAACFGSPTIPDTLRLGTTSLGPSTGADHVFALTPTTFPAEGVASQITRIYAGPGTKVNVTAFPTTNVASMTCNVSISGYFVKL